MLDKLVTKIYRRNDVILVQSKAFEKSICTKRDFRRKLVFAPNWAEGLFERGEKKLITTELLEGFKVMFAGNIGVAQDFPAIIKVEQPTHDIPEIKWVIVGDGRARNDSEKDVERLGLTDTIVFVVRHPVDEIPGGFEKADLMLVTLKDEFFLIDILVEGASLYSVK